MKRDTSGGSKTPKPKTSVQLSGDDAARLVGGIVEKGFPDQSQTRPIVGPSAPPRPTVLPFPVARHRSHGPHWAPKPGNFKANNYNDEVDDFSDGGDEEDFAGMDLAADVANPIQRKEKKGLDFSRWQEIMKNNVDSTISTKKKKLPVIGVNVFDKVENNAPGFFEDAKDESEGRTDMLVDSEGFRFSANENSVQPVECLSNDLATSEKSNMTKVPRQLRQSSYEMLVDSQTHKMPPAQMPSGYAMQKSFGGEEDSLQSQIDAENCARLENMSADEIAEAQSEIITKLSPALVNALKKRGEVKIKKKNFSFPDVVTGSQLDGTERDIDLPNLTAKSLNTSFQKPVKRATGEKLSDETNMGNSSMGSTNRTTWDAWRERVEHVRDMRFSLDGNIIDIDFARLTNAILTHEGNASSQSGYSVDNVTQRDFVRTEGDPGAAGYTIKEAVSLTRSVVPAQRAIALHLIAAVLDRAICCICLNEVGPASQSADSKEFADWEAIWAFALGPEVELSLTLRMALDDNHNSVVLACARAIMCVLSCDMNEKIFDFMESTRTYPRDICTAPVFRSKPDIKFGFLRGGFWKYNTKPSNIFNLEESPGGTPEEEQTIQDDVVVAGQDIAAGLVRMGILQRIGYLLEMDPAASLEEILISILIAIARHSPTCATAIINCERLVKIVADRFALKDTMEITTCKIKSVKLFKVLARMEKKNCTMFMKNGIFQKLTWHLYRPAYSLDQWMKSGREACKLLSALLVEQLRLWKAFIHHGYCISDASDILSTLYIWLSVPTFEKLIDNVVMNEYCAITKELYHILDILAGRLSNIYRYMPERMVDTSQDKEYWSWNHFGPIIDQALEWIDVKRIPFVSKFFNHEHTVGEYQGLSDSELNSFLLVISSVFSMLSSLLKALMPADITSFPERQLPWLPDFVPRIGLYIIRNGYFRFSGTSDLVRLSGNGSLIELLCSLRLKEGQELAISSACCLQVLVQTISSIDNLICLANLVNLNTPSTCQTLSDEDKILASGILKSARVEVQSLLTIFMKLITNEWQCMKLVERFGRGGPAPGVGVGWGAAGGGYWSIKTLLAQQDADVLVCLLENSEISSSGDSLKAADLDFAIQRLSCALAASLFAGPGNSYLFEKLLKVIFQVPTLKAIAFGIRQFLFHRKGVEPFKWNYGEHDYSLFADVLAAHFRSTWLMVKKKQKTICETDQVSYKTSKKEIRVLETIHEDGDVPNKTGEGPNSLTVEWAHQRLHLPTHWFLSAISTAHYETNRPGASHKDTSEEVPLDLLKIAEGELFLLLGIEAIPTFLPSDLSCPVNYVPVVWKLHALSVLLLSGMDVLQDEKSRDVFETLQNVYGGILNEAAESLQFESDVNVNYSTFVETLVEQFAAESYGDMIFGRQIAMYLHGSVESSVRLAVWNALYNARALELLPPLEKCFLSAEGHLEPIQDDEKILEAYVKSWVSGALVKAEIRSSVAFILALHHLSSFIFGDVAGDMLTLRNKLAKSLLRDYSRKQQHQGMMLKLICYERPATTFLRKSNATVPTAIHETKKRLQLLKEISGGDSSLVTAVEKLESCI